MVVAKTGLPLLAAVLSIGWMWAPLAHAHSQDGYTGHDSAMCLRNDGEKGQVACTDPAADPCASGADCVGGFCHQHPQWPSGKRDTPACQTHLAQAGEWHIHGGSRHRHDPAVCGHLDRRIPGSVACTDPAADPCDSGQALDHHSHASIPPGKTQTAACIASRAPAACTDRALSGWSAWSAEACPTRQRRTRTCTDGAAGEGSCVTSCAGAALTEWRANDCIDPPTPERCVCCAGVEAAQVDGWTCGQTCDSLLGQQPDACPVDAVPPPAPTDPDPPPYVPGADQLGCHDNGPGMNDHHTGCPGPNVHPGHNCSSLDYHRHEDAWENECHNEDYAHDETGCGYGWHLHDGLECHDPDSGAHVHDRGHGGTAVTNPPAGAVTKPSPVESGKRCVCCDGMVIRGAAYADDCEARCRSDMDRRGASCGSETEWNWRLLWAD